MGATMSKRKYRKLQKRLTYLAKELDTVSIEVENMAHLLRDLDPRIGAESIHDTIRRLTGKARIDWHITSGAGAPTVAPEINADA
jgi:hypothetical protein